VRRSGKEGVLEWDVADGAIGVWEAVDADCEDNRKIECVGEGQGPDVSDVGVA